MINKFSGAITALITPFKNGSIDFVSFERLVKMQVQKGIQGFVINGTTAESPTLTQSEVEQLFYQAKAIAKNLPIIVGVGSNSTEATIASARKAEKWGADAVLVVVPYYNKPPQRGLFAHFKAVADSINIPVILYNVPGRTITALELGTIVQLSNHPNIVAIKEASGNLDFATRIHQECASKLQLLSGDDESYEGFLKCGGQGIISVASHLIPEAFVKGQIEPYLSLIQACYIEANPIPIKMALYLMGVIDSPECRLPLVTALDSTQKRLQTELAKHGLL